MVKNDVWPLHGRTSLYTIFMSMIAIRLHLDAFE